MIRLICNCAADLRLCFGICKRQVFPWCGSCRDISTCIYTIYDISQACHKKKHFSELQPGCTAIEARGLKFWIFEVMFVCVQV